MSWKLRNEFIRKLIHMMSLSFLIIFYIANSLFGKTAALLSLIVLLLCFVIVDYLRVEMGCNVPFIAKYWRAKEKDGFGGQVTILVSTIIVLAVFEWHIALASVLMGIFGDIVSALVGWHGRLVLFRGKNFEGVFAAFAVNFVIAFLVLDSFLVIFAMSLTATLIDFFTVKLDDNLITALFLLH